MAVDRTFQPGLQAIDVLEQVVIHLLPEWIEDKLHAFPPGELGGRDEVTVPRNENDGVCLFFQRQAGDIQADSHVDALLAQTQTVSPRAERYCKPEKEKPQGFGTLSG
nr:hypothetical protein [Aromatoleum aromaticum]